MTTKYEAMQAALKLFLEMTEEPPEANCSCHVSPPCSYCVDYSGLREAFDEARAALAMPDDPTPEESSLVVPDGWKLVPVYVTDEMSEAAWESDGTDYIGEHHRICRFDLAYKAAISAAPQLFDKAEQAAKVQQPVKALTDDDICMLQPDFYFIMRAFARAIEAKLKC